MFALFLISACSDYELAKEGDLDGGTDDPGRPGDDDDCVGAGPDAPAAETDEACLNDPPPGTWNPTIEWQWNENPLYPGYDDIMAAPSVADVNGDGLPDVVFASFSGGAYTSRGTITAISGDGSGTLWSFYDSGGHGAYSSSGVALGDLEGDGTVEVCFSGTAAAVVCLNGEDGTLKWAAGSQLYGYGRPALADMDGDGLSEVIFGPEVLAADGFVLGTGAGHGNWASFAVDWTGDGRLEAVTGSTVFAMDGTTVLATGGTDGYPAVGDFDLDGRPDLVTVGGSAVTVWLNDGSQLWSTAVPGSGGGPPTVADFDGDGWPEIGVAGLAYYTMFDTDGAVVWSNPVSDYSSASTGSSVFDFEGDGSAEVVYADELHLWVFDGATGSIKMQEEGHASGTLQEYPLVVDVDADGQTEIVLASNNYAYSGWNGITVYGDLDQSWADSRPIWNQFSYHITNVEDDGSIPAVQQDNWLTWNTFRAGGTNLGLGHWLADLWPDEPELCLDNCPAEVLVYLPIGSSGMADAGDFTVGFVDEAGVLVLEEARTGLATGEGLTLGPFTIDRNTWGDGELWAHVDVLEQVDECFELDNLVSLGTWPCE